ncbi:hypothetical protein CXG81DRAFT_23200 [Caulochytrium protostelioides]|uniref:WD40 repeat-like protein n=1 Tax=Caulochytrium protostelioides TaxID=1555241 RepID=A0A4P9XFC4_9FUNG|nr:hypothetical protein CXG81DRAFT_23200 [Caulochytrium protostelioides]|eukprot:RKP04248.1 hypothetical protein CXG81DRAFT_23200 [Caulochytrium protostelioides]
MTVVNQPLLQQTAARQGVYTCAMASRPGWDFIAALDSDNTIALRSWETLQPTPGRGPLHVDHTVAFQSELLTALTADRQDTHLLWTSGPTAGVLSYDLRTGQVAQRFAAHPDRVQSFDVNGEGLVAAGMELRQEDAKIVFWDVRQAGGAPVRTFADCHSDDVTQVKFHPTRGAALATGSTDGLICLFNLAAAGSSSSAPAAAAQADSDGPNDDDDALYQVIKTQSVQSIGYFGPDDGYLWSLTHMEELNLFQFYEGQTLRACGDIRRATQSVALNADMSVCEEQTAQVPAFRAVNHGLDVRWARGSGQLQLWAGTLTGDLCAFDVGTEQHFTWLGSLTGGHEDLIKGVAYHPDREDLVASAGEEGRLCLWQL